MYGDGLVGPGSEGEDAGMEEVVGDVLDGLEPEDEDATGEDGVIENG